MLHATPFVPTIRSSTRSAAALGLAAHARHAHAVRDTRTPRRSGRRCCRTAAPRRTWRPPMPMTFFGQRAHRPVDDVDVVDVLLDDVVAREPGEVEPVAALPLHLAHAGRALLHPQVALVPVALRRDDLADLAVLDALHHLEVARLVTPLRAGDDGEVLLLREVGRGDDRPDADRVDRDRLLHEDVLAGVDGGLEVDGPEARRRRRDDQVDVGERADLLVVVEAREAAVRRHLDARRVLLRQPRERRLGRGPAPGRRGRRSRRRVGLEAVDGGARCRGRRSRSRRP